MDHIRLVRPTLKELPSYVAALERDWSPDNLRLEVAAEQLILIRASPSRFVDGLHDPEAKAGPVVLPNGSRVARLPGMTQWIWDGSFCGSVGLRWQLGVSSLPDYVLGHIGFAVVPWKRGLGCASRGLALMLDEARAVGLAYVELTTDPDNLASQAVIRGCGGHSAERFCKAEAFGGQDALRFRIDL